MRDKRAKREILILLEPEGRGTPGDFSHFSLFSLFSQASARPWSSGRRPGLSVADDDWVSS